VIARQNEAVKSVEAGAQNHIVDDCRDCSANRAAYSP
jgi:hypothetical protein